jgi:hypothetical protein
MTRKAAIKTHLDCTNQEDTLAREVALTTKSLSQCYEAAGYSGKVKVKRSQAMKVLSRPHVAERVEYYKSMAAAKLDLRADRIMAEYAAVAFLDPIDVFNIDEGGYMTVKNLEQIPPWARRAIMSIKQKRSILDGEGKQSIVNDEIEVKFHPKIQALTKLAEIKNMFKEHEKNKAPKVSLDLTFAGAR